MDILVTGGTVFASRFTAEYFRARGHNVYALNRGGNCQSKGVAHIKADRHALGNTLKKYRFDAVLDITAYDREDVRLLFEGLGAFDDYILVSSSAVYPETLEQPFREEQERGANSYWGDYGSNKIGAERFAEENIGGAYIIRPPYLYGPMNNLYREAFVFECAEKDRPFYVPKDGKMKLQFFHIRDMCGFMEILLEKKPKERIFNVGNPETVDVDRWVEMCYGVLGKKPEIRYVGGEVTQRSYFPFHDYSYVLDVTRQNRLMKNTIPTLEGLRESYEWYKNNKNSVKRKPLIEFIDENLV